MMNSGRDRSIRGPREMQRRPSPQPPNAPVPQHDELIRFICDSWTKVMQEYNHQRTNPHAPQTVYFHSENEPNNQQHLKDFVPFDLESWSDSRVRRLVHNT